MLQLVQEVVVTESEQLLQPAMAVEQAVQDCVAEL